MPEGDTIHATAATLRAGLVGRPLVGFDAPGVRGPRPEPGAAIGAIEARGKHLLIRFDGGATLHTHLGMTGSWRIGPSRAATTRGGRPGRAVILTTAAATAVCRDAPVVELLDDAGIRRHPQLSSRGPDLCLPDPDLDEALRRLDALIAPATPVGVALLDQRVAAGIGNVYRAEVLWACRADPFAPLEAVDEDRRRSLLTTAGELLRRNLGGGPRRTVPEGLAVYERAGRPCRRCGTAIAVRRLGEQARPVWWCPACQTAARSSEGGTR